MTVLEFRSSVKDFRLPNHQLGEFVVAFCFSSFINIFLASCIHLDLSTPIRTKLGNFVTPRLYVAALICQVLPHEIKREALELHWNPAMKDEVELPGDFRLDLMQNEL